MRSSAIFVFPVARFVLGKPFESGRKSLGSLLGALRLSGPFYVFAAAKSVGKDSSP